MELANVHAAEDPYPNVFARLAGLATVLETTDVILQALRAA